MPGLDLSPRYLTNEQIPHPLPEGTAVYHRPGSQDTPILAGGTGGDYTYWVDIMGYAMLPPPPDGFVHMVVETPDTNTNSYHARYFTTPEIRTVPVLPNDEQWWSIRPADYRNHRILVPEWCGPSRVVADTAFGPSMFVCWRKCLHRDGCAVCQPESWGVCFGGECNPPDDFRVPPAAIESEICPCFVECVQCSDMVAPSGMYETRDDGRVCRSCKVAYYSQCEHCNTLIADCDLSEHVDYCEQDCSCSQCLDNRGNAGDLINDYSYTPHLIFRGEGKYHLGLELELNTADCFSTRQVAQEVVDHLGDLVYLKEDSSIGDGFEVVTHPMTFEYAMESVDWSIINRLRTQYAVQASSDCGMHVHVSKTAFDTASHTYRWMRFIYRNASSLQQLARRTGSSYASFQTYMNDWSIHYATQSKKRDFLSGPDDSAWYMKTAGARRRIQECGTPYGTARYSAINVENEKTFELRFFASTTRPARLRAALGFVHASIEYTRQLTANKVVTEKGLEFGTFQEWVTGNNTDDRYADLISEMERLVH